MRYIPLYPRAPYLLTQGVLLSSGGFFLIFVSLPADSTHHYLLPLQAEIDEGDRGYQVTTALEISWDQTHQMHQELPLLEPYSESCQHSRVPVPPAPGYATLLHPIPRYEERATPDCTSWISLPLDQKGATKDFAQRNHRLQDPYHIHHDYYRDDSSHAAGRSVESACAALSISCFQSETAHQGRLESYFTTQRHKKTKKTYGETIEFFDCQSRCFGTVIRNKAKTSASTGIFFYHDSYAK